MASLYPAMKGKFGSTEYYAITMKAKDVAKQLVMPSKMPDWGDDDQGARVQRKVNYDRVKKDIAPYLAHDEDRFFGALIVDVINADSLKFEELSNVCSVSNVHELYQTASKTFGFLTFSGKEILVPLDGQHRLTAIQFALAGKDQKQKDIPGLDPNEDLANDDVSLILIKHEQKTRNIFNKVHQRKESHLARGTTP
ncbi:MAG: DGQHR domain-containing protein [Pseudohongiellaceae bacterium]